MTRRCCSLSFIGIVHISVAMLLKTAYAIKRNGFANSLGTIGWTLLIVGGVIVGGFALAGVIDSAVTKWIIIVLGVVSGLGIFLLNDLHEGIRWQTSAQASTRPTTPSQGTSRRRSELPASLRARTRRRYAWQRVQRAGTFCLWD